MTVSAAHPLRLATSAMGTRFELVLYGDDEVQLRGAGECALVEIERLHTQLTGFSDDSLLTYINRTAAKTPVKLDAETYALFEDAIAVYHASAGAFDCTLGTGMERVRLEPVHRSIGFDRFVVGDQGSGIKDQEPRIANPDPRSLILDPVFDLGAIAKGHALDRAAVVLMENGVHCALLHGGTSSVLALDAPPDESAWRIALANHPQRLTIDLCNAALSVSCTLGDRTHNVGHIVDPRGHGPGVMGQGSRSIFEERYCAVVGPSALLADAWSTALIVLGHRPATLGAEWQNWFW